MVTQCPNYRVIDPVKHKLTLIIRGNSSRPETDGCWHWWGGPMWVITDFYLELISKHKIKNLRHRQSSTVPTIKARSSYSISVLKLEKRSCVNATDEKEDNDHKPQSPANRRSAFVAADMHSISMKWKSL